MNFQQKLIEASTIIRARATALAEVALDAARARAEESSRRASDLKTSFATLTVAGRELNRVARRHASRLVKENSAIAVAASKEIGALARSTYASLSGRKPAVKSRKPRTIARRKRTTSKAA